ncbi:helix-turn-helix domain-containing protein [Pseudonocardia halophobica]|uniref:helix-turn-helix domain-containing protein n=1 Tax=Pseudonocardia halophobica TaxID=29401 RepID=UPI003D8D14F5
MSEPVVPDVVGLLERVADGHTTDEQLDALVPAEVLPRVREAVQRIGAGAARARTRELQFAALSSTVRELAELRDLDALLARVVERAHDLMGSDITHLSEFDERTHGLAVRASAGLVSGAFGGVQVPPYSGLAGRVAESRTPLWTSSYTTDEAFPRDPGLDAAVRAEGIVALLGVPLVADQRVLGVLFAADRYEREFSRDDVALLAAFADAVAVVLQSARLLDHEQAAARQAEEARQALAAQVAGMERASRVHEELTAAVLRGAGTAEVAAGLAAELGRPVSVLRSVGGAWVDDAPIEDAAVLDALRVGADTGRVTQVDGDDGPEAVVVVRAGETTPVALTVGTGPVALDPVESRTLERGGQIVALLALHETAVAQAATRARDDLVSDLLSPDPARRHGIGKRLRAHGLYAERLRTVVVATVDAAARSEAVAAAGLVAAVATDAGGAVVALLDSTDPQDAARLLGDRIRATLGLPVVAAGAGPTASLDELHRRHSEARDCAMVLRALGVSAAVAADEYLPYTALFAHAPERVRSFVDLTLGPLLRWDAERGTDLVETLGAYVRSYASPARTARVLGVHVNTVILRLERISALLGDDWRDPDPFFRLTVATRLAELARSGQSS